MLKKTKSATKCCFAYLPPNCDTFLMGTLAQLTDRFSPEIIMGDFNARINNWNVDKITRNSKDTTTNQQGKRFIKIFKKFLICNGTIKGDKEGEHTFINANGASVVHLCLVDKKKISEKASFTVTHSELSHHSIISLSQNSNRSTLSASYKRITWNEKLKEKFCNEMLKFSDEMCSNNFNTIISVI